MEICIRKNYLDKVSLTKTQMVADVNGTKQEVLVYSREDLVKPPYYYQIIEIDDKYSDCVYSDFDFENDIFTFNIDKYNARKQKENEVNYENKIVSLIRQKYTIDQELAILRQRDTKPEEYQIYFDYVEQCKEEAKAEINKLEGGANE